MASTKFGGANQRIDSKSTTQTAPKTKLSMSFNNNCTSNCKNSPSFSTPTPTPVVVRSFRPRTISSISTAVESKTIMAGEIRLDRFSLPSQSPSQSATKSMPMQVQNRNNHINVQKSTGRKLWNLRDRTSVNHSILKANLAEEGCEEAQLDVAKKLLNEAQMSQDSHQNETTRLAVYWLIKSSEQGNEEATKLLDECLQSGKGITCQNVLDVRTCVDTPRNEKFTFKAARMLYARLNNGEEFITTTQLLARLQSRRERWSLWSPIKSPRTLLCQQPEDSSSDNEWPHNESPNFNPNTTFDVDHDSENRKHYNIPNNNSSTSTPTKESDFALSRTGETKYILSNKSILRGVKITQEDLMKTVSAYNSGEIPNISIDPTQQESFPRWNFFSLVSAFVLQFLLISFLMAIVSCRNCLLVVSVYLLAWSSHNLRLWPKRQSSFTAWTDSFKSVLREGTWSELIVHQRLSTKWLTPSLAGSAGSLLLFTLYPNNFVRATCGFIMILSLCRAEIGRKYIQNYRVLLLIFLTLIPFIKNFTLGALEFQVGVGVNLENFREYLFFPEEFIWNWNWLVIPDWLWLSTSSLLYIVQGILLLSILLSPRTAKSFVQVLTVFWFQMTAWCFLDLTIEEIFLSGIVIVTSECVSFLMSCNSKLKGIFALLTSTTVILVISIGLFYLPSLDDSSNRTHTKEPIQYLRWEEYDSNCHTKAWQSKSQSLAENQVRCSKYENAPVQWSGIISLVKLHEMGKPNYKDNNYKNAVFQVLVEVSDDECTGTATSWQWLQFGASGYKNSKEHPAPILVWLNLNDLVDDEVEKSRVLKFVLCLRSGDKIEFKGVLQKNVGGLQPEIGQVRSVKCLSCAIADYQNIFSEKLQWKIVRFENHYLNELYLTILQYHKELGAFLG